MANSSIRICFVCTGNVCRSPLAEAVLRHELERRGIADRFEIDSAGTDAYHVGEPADPRMRRVAADRGVRISHRSRDFRAHELQSFDFVYAMDAGHERQLSRFARTDDERERIRLFRDFDPVTSDRYFPDVPDPWYGDMDGFERVYDIVSRTCSQIADELARDHGLEINGNRNVRSD